MNGWLRQGSENVVKTLSAEKEAAATRISLVMRWFSTTTCMLFQVPERNLREQGSRQSGDSNTQGIFLLVLLSILLSVVVFCWIPQRCFPCLEESQERDSQGIESVIHTPEVDDAKRKCDIRKCLRVEKSPPHDNFAPNKGAVKSPYGHALSSTGQSRDAGKLLPSATTHNGAVGADPTCAICLESYRAGDRVARARNDKCLHHQFHEDCVTRWLLKHNECPCCRINVLEGFTVSSDDEIEDVVLEQGMAIFDRLQLGPQG